jgi:ABC-2 type transport system permease protein
VAARAPAGAPAGPHALARHPRARFGRRSGRDRGRGRCRGAVAKAAIGLTIGYAPLPKAAIATANVVFLPMGFVGGLLGPPELLPDWAATVGWATPMRPWVEASFRTASGGSVEAWLWLLLIGWSVVLCALAAWAYRRDQVRRYA